mgnify:CR=1 FL=1
MKKLLITTLVALASTAAFADSGTGADYFLHKHALYFLAVAIAAFGGTMAQSRAASVALEGIARNPGAADKLMTPMILGLALMESLVIFTWATVFIAK